MTVVNRATNLGWLQGDTGGRSRATPSGWIQQVIQADPRYARPTTDTATGAWTPSTGTSLAGCIDETSYDDADYIATQTSAVCTMTLGPVTDPVSSGGHVIKFRAKSPNSNTLTVTLKQGGTTIKTSTTAALTSSFADYTMTLTGAEADSITDYTALSITLQANT